MEGEVESIWEEMEEGKQIRIYSLKIIICNKKGKIKIKKSTVKKKCLKKYASL